MHNLSRRKARAQPDMPVSALAKDERSATSVDQHVGKRIAKQRELGLPVTQLAAQLGVSYQQVYKYEQGTNRITSGQLYIIAQIFGVGVGWFFEGIAGALSGSEDPLPFRQMQDLANNFAAISNDILSFLITFK
jgi:transcriptional regulator with XRE-family HTH domain